jgi:Prokaryotic N-terminal methylation motif
MTTRSRQRGYTAVEVLSALTLLAIGGAGVIGMQKVTLQGSEDARRFDIGGNIANEWLSRLQRDSAQWTQPNANFPNANNINLTQWLRLVPVCSAAFCDPAAVLPPDGMSGSFDTFGHDLPAAGLATYCAQFRLQWIADIGPAPPFNPAALIRAEVRVFWSRLELNPIGNCGAATPNAVNANELYHFIVATTAVRESALK